MRAYLIIISSITLLILNCSGDVLADLPKNQCANFDHVALQLALTQNKMQAPLNLEAIQLFLGAGISETSSNISSYSWIHKERILLVTVSGDNISNKMLTGKDDGSMISKKMEQIYSNLKSATSVWSIKEIQNQLGSGYIKSNKLNNYTWHCGSGSLTIAVNENNDIVSAVISYRAPLDSIESRVEPNHPEWNVKTDSLGQSYRAWQRSFAN